MARRANALLSLTSRARSYDGRRFLGDELAIVGGRIA
jgi:hypothetical protein